MKKRILCLCLTGLIVSTSLINVFGFEKNDIEAVENNNTLSINEEIENYLSNTNETNDSIDLSGKILINEKEYYDSESDSQITEKLYVTMSRSGRAASGNGEFTNTKTAKYDSGDMTYWVTGKFTWDSSSKTAKVSNVSGGSTTPRDHTKSNASTDYNSNQGGFIGKVFAYAKYSFSITNKAGMKKNYSVYVDVNVDGQSSTK